MHRQKGYSFIELAIVLVILALLAGGILSGYGLWKDRAEYLSNGRTSELEELLEMNRAARSVAAPIPVLPPPPVEEAPPIPDSGPHREDH